MSEENVVDLFSTSPVSAEGASEGESVGVPPDPFLGRDDLVFDFLLWLWFRSEHDFGVFKLGEDTVDLWIDDRLAFRALEEAQVSSTFSGDDAGSMPEARLSVLSGKVLSEVRVGARRAEHEMSFTLRVSAGTLQLHGVKVSTVVKKGVEEMLEERLYLLEEVVVVVQQLFGVFFRERISPQWEASTVKGIEVWLTGEET